MNIDRQISDNIYNNNPESAKFVLKQKNLLSQPDSCFI